MTALADPAVDRDHAEVEHFYARQMRLLDSGEADAWAATFTEGARGAVAALAAEGETHRHWVGMLAVRPRGDGSLLAESYVQVVAVRPGEGPRLHLMCTCADVFVRQDGELLVRERVVTRDDRR
ncbi:nuclear transport factor 2 family protein [Streptomyces luteoverticillatus]|uniref:Nuclear transport factor 2 family protein n=1 Tax=Streptomyces luteoverticillatus TaxID=66425 RepID=A0A3Q9G2M9_STRLT|nr:nuclear transport factor 2 family protein [Streptomyces luteoverticillatus]AZQ74564.1 nuclear transport factor 2 family protein [Streptomyces luteoverticillatus]